MKQTILFYSILFLMLCAGVAGGFYVYTTPTNEAAFVADNDNNPLEGSVQGEEIDETIISTDPAKFINSGPAPSLVGLTNWTNSSPLALADLTGKVVLINFWTYSCIDCTKAIPYMIKWHNTYKDQGLVTIGVHTPQFVFEKVTDNVNNAIKGQAIPYVVAQDNDFKTWIAYKNQFWPATYLIDKSGNLVYSQVGGGKYGQTEKAVRTLLGLEGDYQIPDLPAAVNPDQTPDIFTGLTKLSSSFGGSEKVSTDEQIYVFPKKLPKNKFALEGSWKFDQESAIHTKGYGRLITNFNAASISMVAQSPEPVTVKVYIDDLLVKGVVVKEIDDYLLFESLTRGTHTLRLELPDSTMQINSFIFK